MCTFRSGIPLFQLTLMHLLAITSRHTTNKNICSTAVCNQSSDYLWSFMFMNFNKIVHAFLCFDQKLQYRFLFVHFTTHWTYCSPKQQFQATNMHKDLHHEQWNWQLSLSELYSVCRFLSLTLDLCAYILEVLVNVIVASKRRTTHLIKFSIWLL